MVRPAPTNVVLPTGMYSYQQFTVVPNDSGGDGPRGITVWEMNALLLFAG